MNRENLIHSCKLSEIDSIEDSARGIYGWFPPVPNPYDLLNEQEKYMIFYTKLYPNLIRIKHESNQLILEAKIKTPELHVEKEVDRFIYGKIMSNLVNFIPPLYIGSSARDENYKSIKQRVKEEKKQKNIGEAIKKALIDANINRVFTIDDFIIKYVNVLDFLDNSKPYDYEYIKNLSRVCERTFFTMYFPWLNKKGGA